MNEAQKAVTIEWIKEQVGGCHRMRANAPHHWPGFSSGLLQAVWLIQRQVSGTREASLAIGTGHPPETIAEHLEVLKREMAIHPPMQAIAALSQALADLTTTQHQEAA